MLKLWNMLLVILAFMLSLFGTFLTRSGSSTRSTRSPRARSVPGSSASSSSSAPRRRPSSSPGCRCCARDQLESPVSREATFPYNNLLLVALCLTILWGVLWPILTEAVRGESSVVAGPYYNFFLRVFGLPLLLLMGIAPLIAWRRAFAALGRRSVRLARGRGGGRGRGPARAGRGLVDRRTARVHVLAFVLGSIGYEFVRERARRALTGAAWHTSFSSSSRETAGGTAGTSCTPRSSCSRSASPVERIHRALRPPRTG